MAAGREAASVTSRAGAVGVSPIAPPTTQPLDITDQGSGGGETIYGAPIQEIYEKRHVTGEVARDAT
ncbi:unnamed protein product [Danaus chrysippus]|uniref:(African queen) hypothetical protein n=1 Tax=Danaus chrysippus TaxID=151541 RepID=A0A8J2QHJ1_9NEOP|nr:unnamed protein product [Danaus chrysippus]